MIIDSKTAEERAVLDAAYKLCVAARTAPKACGIDHLQTCVITGEDKDVLAEQMRKNCNYDEKNFMFRDSKNVDNSIAVVLVGVKEDTRHLGKQCQLCHFEGCTACAEAGACCVFDMIDLGIAIGSAVAAAADMRIDNRVMFTIGKAAVALGHLEGCNTIMGIPLAVAGKSPFYDREAQR